MNNIKYGLNSNVSTLKTVLLKNPQAAFKSQKTIDLQTFRHNKIVLDPF